MEAREIFNSSFAIYYEKVINRISSPIQVNRWRTSLVRRVRAFCPDARLVMDFCSGAGDVGKIFLRGNPDALFINCDISRPLLELAKERLGKRAFYVCSDNKFFPVKDSILDVLFSSFCVRNSSQPLLTIREAFRVLRSRGVWGILDFFRVDSANFATVANNLVFRSFMNMNKILAPSHSEAIDYLFESIKNFYSVEEFVEVLRENGFEVAEVKSFMGGIANTVIAVKRD